MSTILSQVFGTPQTVFDSATDIAAGNFSGATSVYDNTSDGAVPNALFARATIQIPDWGGTPVANTLVELWGVLQDVDGTSDDTDAPSGTAAGGARFFGAFIIAAADALQRRTINISMEGVEKVIFYIKNGTVQNMNNDAGTNLTLKITPYTLQQT